MVRGIGNRGRWLGRAWRRKWGAVMGVVRALPKRFRCDDVRHAAVRQHLARDERRRGQELHHPQQHDQQRAERPDNRHP
jgi:hypothetical protein